MKNTNEKFFLENLARSIASTEEFDRIVCALAPHLVNRWAGRNIVKKAVARPVAKSIQKSFSENNKSVAGDGLLSNPSFAKAALSELPELINAILASLVMVAENISALPDEEKEAELKSFFGKLEAHRVAELINGLLRVIVDIHKSNPHFFAQSLAPVVASFIKTADFGELKEAVESSAEDVGLLVRHINETLWEYPAKVICVLSLLPSLANMLVRAGVETLAPINRMAPDLLTDVVLSLAGEMKGGQIGALVNQLCELVRKVHTGSALLGDPGKPQLPRVVSSLAEDVLGAVDWALLLKAMDLLGDIRNMLWMSFADAAEKHPELVKGMYRQKFRAASSSLRRLSRQLDLLESCMDDDETAQSLAQGMAEIDPQELASVINHLCFMYNRAKESNSGVVRDALSQTVASFDYHELGLALRGIIEDSVDALRPVACEIMPPIVRGFAELLSENDGSGEMSDALEKFRNAIMGKEVAR